jgi:transcriptional regulator with XRE-family HTH domain
MFAALKEKDLPKAFGLALKKLRSEAGLSQDALAKDCKLDRTFISLLERGERQPTITTIYKVAEALEVTVQQLIIQIDNQMNKKS